ncbi:MAG TPA: HAD-IIB family hydrolase [Lautropia sp.]|jgi:HAD superfamily hydrolase (TIGR01484 family)|nr:HAD-IIB family hydrolase [Lautropia sp.]
MTASWLPVQRLDLTGLHGVFTDIDDTLTTAGKLSAAVYLALERLRDAGFAIVPVTGRSAGWAHMVLHHWPVEAVIAESGGLCLYRDAVGIPRWLYHDDAAQIARDRIRIGEVAQEVMARIPGLALADDNAFRLVDFALDHCETVAPVAPDLIDEAIAMFRADGLQARASSVHINIWRGEFDKAPMSLRYLKEIRGATLPAEVGRWLFVGDAPNDASMFAAFPCSVGVANLAPHADRLAVPPPYLSRASHGEGFVEIAEHLLRR